MELFRFLLISLMVHGWNIERRRTTLAVRIFEVFLGLNVRQTRNLLEATVPCPSFADSLEFSPALRFFPSSNCIARHKLIKGNQQMDESDGWASKNNAHTIKGKNWALTDALGNFLLTQIIINRLQRTRGLVTNRGLGGFFHWVVPSYPCHLKATRLLNSWHFAQNSHCLFKTNVLQTICM